MTHYEEADGSIVNQLKNVIASAKENDTYKAAHTIIIQKPAARYLRGGPCLNYIALQCDKIDGIHRLRTKTESTGLKIRTGSPYNFLLLNEKVECLAALSRIVIGPDLHIFPCDAFKGILAKEIVNTEQYSVLSKYSLRQCWKQSHYLKAVRETVCAEYHDQCQQCVNLKRCKSGCLAQKIIQDRRLTSRPDPDCIMT